MVVNPSHVIALWLLLSCPDDVVDNAFAAFAAVAAAAAAAAAAVVDDALIDVESACGTDSTPSQSLQVGGL